MAHTEGHRYAIEFFYLYLYFFFFVKAWEKERGERIATLCDRIIYYSIIFFIFIFVFIFDTV